MRSFLIVVLFVSGSAAQAAEPLTWDEVRYGGVIEQRLDNSCGITTILTLMHFTFNDTRHNERSMLKLYIEQATEEELGLAMRDGLSLAELAELSQKTGYATRSFNLSLAQLEQIVLKVPVLVYLEVSGFRHFAVLKLLANGRAKLADPSRGNMDISQSEFLKEWQTNGSSGYAMVILPQ